MGCAGSAPAAADVTPAKLSRPQAGSMSLTGDSGSGNSGSGSAKKHNALPAPRRGRLSIKEHERSNVNLLDFMAHQLGESTDPLHENSLAEQFNAVFSAVFDPVWDSEDLPARRREGMDAKLLGTLRKLFAMGPTSSRDMIRWKHSFKMRQRTSPDSLECRGDFVTVHLAKATVAHAFAALGLVQSLEFVLDNSAVKPAPKRSAHVLWLTPMDLALMYDRVAVAELLANRYDVDPLREYFGEDSQFGSQHVSGIGCAAGNGALDAVRFLLARGADPNSALKSRGGGVTRDASVLYWTIARALGDYREVACALVEAGAEAELGTFSVKSSRRDKIVESPLMAAARIRDVALAQDLVRLRADPDFRSEQTGASALHAAAGTPGNGAMLQYLLGVCESTTPLEADGAGVTPLMLAKDGADEDDGANAKVLSDAAKTLRGTGARQAGAAGDALQDAPEAAELMDPALGDCVELRVGYEQQRRLKGALRWHEAFWGVVVARGADARGGESLDVEIDDVLAVGSDRLGGLNFRDTLLDVPLRKVFKIHA